jgi:glycosyltransferase involved in cell wall biosynthesis
VNKRYLFITSYTLPDHSGSGINAYNFANFLNETGSPAHILTFNRNLSLKRVEYVDKTKIIRIPIFNKNIILKILSLPIILYYYSINIIRSQIIYIYGSKIILYELIILLAWLFQKKIIFQSLLLGIDDLKIIYQKGRGIKWVYKFLFRHIDIYHSINPEFSKHYTELIKRPEKILEIPQGINIKTYFPVDNNKKRMLREKLEIPSGLLLVSAGFLIRRKGYKRIFQTLSNLDIPFTYIILGDFHFHNNHFLLKSEIEGDQLYKLGKTLLQERLQFRGFVSNIDEYLQCADIFIHGSHQEGLPNVLLEAMATALPVLSYDIPGLKDFLLYNGQNCFIYNANDELIPFIKKVAQNDSLANKLGIEANYFISHNCTFDIVLSALLNKLESSNEVGS